MKITFFPVACVPCYPNILETRPLGGTETALVRLAERLAHMGHDVTVFTENSDLPETPGLYRAFPQNGDTWSTDVLVACRYWSPLFSGIEAKVKVLWTQDASFAQSHFGIGDRRIASVIDMLITVSRWHANTLCRASGFPRRKTVVLQNGVHPQYFEEQQERNIHRLIYSSTPHRGLVNLPSIFRQIKEVHPQVELHVFSNYDVYKGASGSSELEERHIQKLERLSGMPGVFLRGNVLQKELAREYMRSGILAYPNHFPETSCITALEAQAAGCPVVTTKLGALKETVGNAGILIPGDPASSRYQRLFVAAISSILGNEKLYSKLSGRAKQRVSRNYTWDRVAERFVSILGARFSKSL